MIRLSTKLYMQGGSLSVFTLLFTKSPDGPGNDWSCVILYFSAFSPFLFMDVCSVHPKGARAAFGSILMVSTLIGRVKPFLTSSEMRLFNMILFFLQICGFYDRCGSLCLQHDPLGSWGSASWGCCVPSDWDSKRENNRYIWLRYTCCCVKDQSLSD